MYKRKRRSASSEEEGKENRMEKRLRRLEEAILKNRGKKHHKKRRRRHLSSESSQSSRDAHSRSSLDGEDSHCASSRRLARSQSQKSGIESIQEIGLSGNSGILSPLENHARSRGSNQQQATEFLAPQRSFIGPQADQQTCTQPKDSLVCSAVVQSDHQTETQSKGSGNHSAVNNSGHAIILQSGGSQSLSAADQVGKQTASQSELLQPLFPVNQQPMPQPGSQQIVSVAVHQTPQNSLTEQQSQGDLEKQSRSEIPLDPAILEIMGKRFMEERVLAPPIPREMILRWDEILKKGLPTEDRVTLIKKYPPPANCLIIDPPQVNPEVQASLQESVVKRDERILAKQTKIAACLAAIGKSFLKILEGVEEKIVILEHLSDAGRLLSDLQHDESLIRKSLILANLNAAFKDILNATVPDELLFGKQLEEKLKAAKALESSRKELKGAPKSQPNRNQKNSKAPPRRQQGNQKPSTTSGGKRDSKNQGYSSYRRDHQRNENSGKNYYQRYSDKYERNSNRKRY